MVRLSINKNTRSRRWLVRGESTIASSGLLLAAIMLFALAGSAWWSAQSQHDALAAARRGEIESIAELLGQLTEATLALDDVTSLRHTIADSVRRYAIEDCKVVLPDGEVIAAASLTDITLAALPETWSSEPVLGSPLIERNGTISIGLPLTVPGRGSARLDLAVPTARAGAWSALDTQVGVGVIGAVALVLLLAVYRRMRRRMRSLSYIREALLAIDAGETSLAALTVQPDLGPEAAAWNELLVDRERLQQVLVTKRMLELPSARQERSHDLTNMCDAMPQGLLLVDRNLQITYANGAAALYVGKDREQVLGMSVDHTIEESEVLDTVRSIAEGTLRRSGSVEVERTNGDSATVLRFSIRPLRAEDNSAAMVVIEDVTQQRLADESRNTFVAQVTHELRTPLTNILLYAETAMEEETDIHMRAKCLNVINQEAHRLERIVGDMLSVAELEAGTHTVRMDDVSLTQLFDDLRLDYEASASEKKITLTFDLPPKLPTIQADRDKIALAVHNLLGNALKYTPDEGHVLVHVECDDNTVSVRVQDDGIGMRPEDQGLVFEKFYRAKDERVADVTGSGLGLALAREVIRLHGGDITVESQIDEGSTFTLTVPILAAAA